MNWSNLKNNECPKCKSVLVDRGHFYKCPKEQCGFSIFRQKFVRILSDMYKKPKQACGTFDEDGNLSRLNNMKL